MSAIGSLGNNPGVPIQWSLGDAQPAGAAGSASFKDLLLDTVKQVNAMQQDANQAVESLMSGDDVNPAEVMTAVQKADLAFRLTMQIRNKLMAAYDEVKNIRV